MSTAQQDKYKQEKLHQVQLSLSPRRE